MCAAAPPLRRLGPMMMFLACALPFLARAAAVEAAAECPDNLQADEEAEIMEMRLLQSDFALRRARAKGAVHELLEDVLGVPQATSPEPATLSTGEASDARPPESQGALPQTTLLEFANVSAGHKQSPESRGAGDASGASEKFAVQTEKKSDLSWPKVWRSAKSIAMSALAIRIGSSQSFFLDHHDESELPRNAEGDGDLDRPPWKWRMFMPWGMAGLWAQKSKIGEDGITVAYLLDVRRHGLGEFGSQLAIDCALVMLIGAIYMHFWKQPPHQLVAASDDVGTDYSSMGMFHGRWRHDFWSCLAEPEICCCACLCPGVRWGETMSYVPALSMFGDQESYPMSSFWAWLLLYLAFSVGTSILFFPIHDVSRVLLLPAALACFRSQLRGRFGMTSGCCVWIGDCLLYSCCAVCTLTQDARQVEHARRHGFYDALVGHAVKSFDLADRGGGAAEKPTSA